MSAEQVYADMTRILDNVKRLSRGTSAAVKKREFFDFSRKKITAGLSDFPLDDDKSDLLDGFDSNDARSAYAPHESDYILGEDAIPRIETLKAEMSDAVYRCFDLSDEERKDVLLGFGHVIVSEEAALLDSLRMHCNDPNSPQPEMLDL